MGDFFAPRGRNRSKQLDVDENAAPDEQTADEEPQVIESVKTEHVRRSSRLSAQVAATAIARALQVTVSSVCI